MALIVIQGAKTPQYETAGNNSGEIAGVTAMQMELPPELVLPDRRQVLNSITSLEAVKSTHLNYATTLSGVMTKLQEFLDEVKSIEEREDAPYQQPT